jgi:hypothetical protein
MEFLESTYNVTLIKCDIMEFLQSSHFFYVTLYLFLQRFLPNREATSKTKLHLFNFFCLGRQALY